MPNPLARAESPFDEHARRVATSGYHAHRGSTHSDVISERILDDIVKKCPALREDLLAAKVGCWLNIKIPFHEGTWDADLVIAEADDGSISDKTIEKGKANGLAAVKGAKPDGNALRLVIEHKSVVTAHRNRGNRFKELATDVKYSNDAGSNVIVAATILLGTAPQVLNVVDGVRKRYRIPGKVGKYNEPKFDAEVGHRLRAKDPKVWEDFAEHVSFNKPGDAQKTAEYFRTNLPERSQDRWNQPGIDALLVVPVFYDNVGTAYVDRDHALGSSFDTEYGVFLDKLCKAYTRRWKTRR